MTSIPRMPGRSGPALLAAIATVFALAAAGSMPAAAASPATPSPASGSASYTHACADAGAGHARCWAEGVPGARGGTGARPAAPSGFGPSDIQSAYDLPSGGSGATVAIVDAYDDPNAASDLATYRSQYGLPACTTASGCFTKVDQTGGTTPPQGDSGWSEEITLDLDAVSAACPSCHILLVEANDNNDDNLYAADDEAVKLGAKFVSNSWSDSESSGETSSDSHFDVPGVLFAFATGDNGYSMGTQYPASSRYTLAVGGTSLSRGGGSRGWTESAWSGAGSGCSAYEKQPSWQSGVVSACGSEKGTADISADADPNTGIAIYDTYSAPGWQQYGGTSLATPLITAMYALAGTPGANDDPASYPYAHRGALNDVTSGSNGDCGTALCDAGTGWDGPTGLGTPEGVSAFTPGGGTTGVTVANPGDQNGTVGTAITPVRDSASGGTAPYTWSASGLPAGLSIDSSSGTISGTPTAAGTSQVTVTAKDSTGATGSAPFTWTVTSGGGSGTVTVGNPGNQVWITGYAINSLRISATDSKNLPLTYRATGLPSGLRISTSGVISGTPTASGDYTVKVTATDSGGANGSTTFTWTILA
ncbi:putative Ig domain-containing protein [Streptantibioticus parmotrematis]|uniref:putative Ig domain-containing protein n=1 Tax=Streptantibioticus parmotrematis TaxID=2873249 RepID=UPI0033FAF70A